MNKALIDSILVAFSALDTKDQVEVLYTISNKYPTIYSWSTMTPNERKVITHDSVGKNDSSI